MRRDWVWGGIFVLGALLAVVVIILVRSLGEPLPKAKPVKAKVKKENLELTLSIPKEKYKPREEISIRLILQNLGQTSKDLSFGDAQRFDFWVKNAQNQEVWRWSSGMVFAQVMGEETLEPEKSLTYKISWDGKDSEEKPVPPGKYIIWGIIGTEPKIQAGPAKVTIEIRD